MTLSERVRRAGNASPKDSADIGAEAVFEMLKRHVQRLISIDEIALLARENPERARNEVRSACRRAFEGSWWDPVDEATRKRAEERLIDVIFGFGILEDLLSDESITEIMVNGPDRVFYERDGRLFPAERTFSDEAELRALIDRILGPLGRRIDEASPMVDARLPQGHRVNVIIPPIALNGPTITIRKFTQHVITLDEMERGGTIDAELHRFLVWAVQARRSIAVSGGTGSGKTTLLNALSCVIPHSERIVTIEDSAELRFFEHPHVVSLEARPRNAEGMGQVTIRDLVINSLRMRPDRIIVGECRGAEALDMLAAMNTGHAGSLTTLHANTPEEAISRLTTMVRYEADLPVDVIEANIASAIDLVVQTQRTAQGMRLITDVVSFKFDRDRERCETIPLYKRAPDQQRGRWVAIPSWVDSLSAFGIAREQEVRAWKQACSYAV